MMSLRLRAHCIDVYLERDAESCVLDVQISHLCCWMQSPRSKIEVRNNSIINRGR